MWSPKVFASVLFVAWVGCLESTVREDEAKEQVVVVLEVDHLPHGLPRAWQSLHDGQDLELVKSSASQHGFAKTVWAAKDPGGTVVAPRFAPSAAYQKEWCTYPLLKTQLPGQALHSPSDNRLSSVGRSEPNFNCSDWLQLVALEKEELLDRGKEKDMAKLPLQSQWLAALPVPRQHLRRSSVLPIVSSTRRRHKPTGRNCSCSSSSVWWPSQASMLCSSQSCHLPMPTCRGKEGCKRPRTSTTKLGLSSRLQSKRRWRQPDAWANLKRLWWRRGRPRSWLRKWLKLPRRLSRMLPSNSTRWRTSSEEEPVMSPMAMLTWGPDEERNSKPRNPKYLPTKLRFGTASKPRSLVLCSQLSRQAPRYLMLPSRSRPWLVDWQSSWKARPEPLHQWSPECPLSLPRDSLPRVQVVQPSPKLPQWMGSSLVLSPWALAEDREAGHSVALAALSMVKLCSLGSTDLEAYCCEETRQNPRGGGLGGFGYPSGTPQALGITEVCKPRRRAKTHRGGGFGVSGKTKAYTHVLFANVTSGSESVAGWVKDCQHDIICLAEVHHRGSKLQGFAKDLKATGRWIVATEANPSGRSDSGTTGGVAILPKESLEVSLPTRSEQKLGCWSSKNDTAFLNGVQLNLRKGVQILILSSYHLDEPSVEILAEVHKRTGGGTVPFILFGDYNLDRKVFEERFQPWLVGLRAATVGGGEATCSLGQRLELDFAIASTHIIHLIEFEKPIWAVPFGPHAAISMKISRIPSHASTWTLKQPKNLPPFNLEFASSAAGLDCWKDALEEAKADIGEGNWADQLDCSLAVTHRAAELWNLKAAGSGFVKQCQLHGKEAYLGRGQGLRWTKARLTDDRGGPLAFCRVDATGQRATRAAATFRQAISRLTRRPQAPSWQAALQALLFKENEMVELMWSLLGSEAGLTTFKATASFLAACYFAESDLQDEISDDSFGTAGKLALELWDLTLDKLNATASSQANSSWREFVLDAVAGSAKVAHAFVKADPSQAISLLSSEGLLGVGPKLAEEADIWAKEWGGRVGTEVTGDAYLAAKAALQEGIDDTTQFEWDRIDELLSPSNLKTTAATFPPKTSTGCDLAKLSWLSALPIYIWHELAIIARNIVRRARIPSQVKPVMLFLLGKKGGGYRTIGVINSFLRVVMRALGPMFRNFDEIHADPTDSATGGSGGAEYAAFTAAIADETDTCLGTTVVRVFWDLRKFFDSIQPGILAIDCHEGGLAPPLVALALEVHGAPRFLGLDGSFQGPTGDFSKSIVAGCTSSTTLCRQFVRIPPLAARQEEESVEDWRHIDDVCQRTVGVDPADVCTRSIRAGIAFAESAQGRGLTIASKSVVVSTAPRLAEYIAKEFREAGYDVGAAGSTEMLGVRTQLAGKRDLATARARWDKFKARVQRISMLSKVTKQAARLFTSHVSVATYGGGSIGSDPKQQRLLAQAGAKAAGKHGFQPCPTSVCALTFRTLPSVQPVVKLFTWWIRWYRELAQDATVIEKLSRAWARWRDEQRHLGQKERWKLVSGPTQALIAHMWDWGWVPAYPSWWVKPPEEAATIGLSAASDGLLVKQVTQAAELGVEACCSSQWQQRPRGGVALLRVPSVGCQDLHQAGHAQLLQSSQQCGCRWSSDRQQVLSCKDVPEMWWAGRGNVAAQILRVPWKSTCRGEAIP